MSYPALNTYLERLATGAAPSSSLRLSGDGEVQGHIFNCWLGSAFHPIRELGSGKITAFAGRVRGVSAEDQGLPVWNYLDGAASDDESIALDRLCRTLHAINFFQRGETGALTHWKPARGRCCRADESILPGCGAERWGAGQR